MAVVHHRYATVQGQELFYREAGPADAPAIVLLHGFPTSSFMFRDLIPALADRCHVIAPDHLGFGLSAAPSADEFDYTFDALADLTAALLEQLGVARYALYVQDYGARSAGASRWPTRKPSPRSSPKTATATTPASWKASGRPCGTTSGSRPPRPKPASVPR
jgi:pimeloyl-ACP methyl ester carboxylesterase